jgi:hypothetical protein
MPEILTLPGVKGKFVAGLSWRHEDREPKRKSLRARAEALDARWAVVHKTRTGHFQAGFCAPIGGVKSGQVKPLAALVADSHPQPWFGIYKLADDLYWYIAVRDGQEILPDGDQVGTLDEMLAAHQAHLRYGEWQDFSGTERDLAQIVKKARQPQSLIDKVVRKAQRSEGLTDIYGERQRVVGGLLGAVAIGTALTLGYKWHAQHQIEEQRAAALARQRAQQAILAAQDAKQHVQPWTQLPVPSAVIAACAAAWHSQDLASAGWVLSSWSCKVDPELLPKAITLAAYWTRAGGLAANAPGALLDGDHSKSLVVRSVPFELTHDYNDDVAASSRAAYSFAQGNALQMKLTEASLAGALPGAAATNAATVDPWKTSDVDITLPMSPWLGLASAFDAVPGLRVTEIQLDSTMQWHTLGRLYEARAIGNGTATKKGV